jgi:hypothetical protein
MLTVSEITSQIERGEIAWPGELRGDGLPPVRPAGLRCSARRGRQVRLA